MARMRAVLPAPLGPSRPATPGLNEHDTSVRATSGRTTPRPPTTTVGSGTKAGSNAGGGAGGGSGIGWAPAGG